MVQAIETFVEDQGSGAEPCEPLGGDRHGGRVPIQAEHRQVRVRLEDPDGVARPADGAVDHPAGWHGTEGGDDLDQQHRAVREGRVDPVGRRVACRWGAAHRQPPGIRSPAGMYAPVGHDERAGGE